MSRVTVTRTTSVLRNAPYDADIRVYIDGEHVGDIVHGAPDRTAVKAIARHARATGQDLEQVMRAVCAMAVAAKG